MVKLICDTKGCKEEANNFLYNNSCMCYYYTELSKNDVSRKKERWKKFCEKCYIAWDIKNDLFNEIREIMKDIKLPYKFSEKYFKLERKYGIR